MGRKDSLLPFLRLRADFLGVRYENMRGKKSTYAEKT